MAAFSRPSNRHIPLWIYKVMLVVAAAIWGLGTVVIKDTVDALPPLILIGIRFTLAGLILTLFFIPRVIKHFNTEHLVAGVVLGIALALGYAFNSEGIAYTTASKSSFLTATYCVLVPFISWIIAKQRPHMHNLIAAILCIVGVWFVSMQAGTGFDLCLGDVLTLISAFFLGLHLALVSRLANGRDMVVLTCFQFVVAGVVVGIIGLIFEPVPGLEVFDANVMFNLFYLIVFASCLTLTLQNVGLAHVAAAPASLLLATESIFGVVFSIVLLGDVMTSRLLIGFFFIGLAIVVSEVAPELKHKNTDATTTDAQVDIIKGSQDS